MGTEDLSVFDNISLSANVTSIANHAFEGIPITYIGGEGVTHIGDSSFANCKKLAGFNFENVQTIDSQGFRYCNNLKNSAYLPKVTLLGSHAFRDSTLRHIIAPNVINIGMDCFYSNMYLQSADLGNINITDGFVNNKYCFEFNAACIVILRYGYVLDADSGWFYSNSWLNNKNTPGTLYVWQNLIEGYRNHSVWGPLLASNNNKILPIEGSGYENNYGDGTPIITGGDN